jgi:hypothetical protein
VWNNSNQNSFEWKREGYDPLFVSLCQFAISLIVCIGAWSVTFWGTGTLRGRYSAVNKMIWSIDKRMLISFVPCLSGRHQNDSSFWWQLHSQTQNWTFHSNYAISLLRFLATFWTDLRDLLCFSNTVMILFVYSLLWTEIQLKLESHWLPEWELRRLLNQATWPTSGRT